MSYIYFKKPLICIGILPYFHMIHFNILNITRKYYDFVYCSEDLYIFIQIETFSLRKGNIPYHIYYKNAYNFEPQTIWFILCI